MLKPFLVFLHIEKTGGITLNNILHQSLPGYVTPRPDYGSRFEKVHLDRLQKWYPLKIQGIGGHRIDPTVGYRTDQFTFTFIRKPIDRYLSHLHYQIYKMGIDWKLEDYLNNPYFNNFQTYRIAGQTDLQKAKQVMDKHLDFIGLVEHFNQSLGLLKVQLPGLDLKMDYQKSNVTLPQNKRFVFEELSKKYQDQIVANNQLDIELYELVQSKWLELLKKHTSVLPEVDQNRPFPREAKLKRKISNFYVGRLIQPFILTQEKQEKGY